MANRQKQTELNGIGRKEIKEVEQAAEAYVKVRDSRMKLTEQEVAAKEELAVLMKKHKLTKYGYEGERENDDTGETEPVDRVIELEKQDAKLTVRVPKSKASASASVEEKEEEQETEK